MIQYATVHFLGGAETVTGSKFLIQALGKKILIDCGMFQGVKEIRELNWIDLPINISDIDVVLLTHGHLDHIGYLPRLIKQGYSRKIIGSSPTLAIAEIVLMDSAKIHEESAEKANKEQYTKHNPALPLYTISEAIQTIGLFESANEGEWYDLSENIRYRFNINGHILGSTFIELEINDKILVFSGDVGRVNDVLLAKPKKPKWADYLFVESTYGHKLHAEENIELILSELIKKTILKQGNLIIPSFAVERLQALMYILWSLYKKNKIPNIPVFIDSPMGNNVLGVFKRFHNWHKLSITECEAMCTHFEIIESYRDTWNTIDNTSSKVIISGSGMVTGGRVLTYLQQLIDEESTTVLLVGYQAEGTRGRQLKEGSSEIKFFGKYYPVKAQIKNIESLSAHADQKELLDWMNEITNVPEKVFLIHGELIALDVFRVKIKDVYGWNVSIPKYNEKVQIII